MKTLLRRMALPVSIALAAVSAQAQTITEFGVGIPLPYGITAGPDGNVWFTAIAGPWIGRIAPDGAITAPRANA